MGGNIVASSKTLVHSFLYYIYANHLFKEGFKLEIREGNGTLSSISLHAQFMNKLPCYRPASCDSNLDRRIIFPSSGNYSDTYSDTL